MLKVLPDEIPVNQISNFLVTALDKAISDRRLYQVNRGLLYAKLLKVKHKYSLMCLKLNLFMSPDRFNSRGYFMSHKILL